MLLATVSINIDLVADTVLVVAVKEDRIAACGIFFARVKDVLDDKIEFAAGIVRRNSLDEFARRLPVAVGRIDFADVFKLSITRACGIVQKNFW